jgi:hypothetical protein
MAPLVALPLRPCGFSTAPIVGRDLYLVILDGHMGSVVIDQLFQHHSLDSPGGH